MSPSRKAWLALETGQVFEGIATGADGERGGDLVFNTAMTGYHEILTDPSYSGQVVLMTYPLIGNYGVAEEDAESARAWAEGFITKEMCDKPSSHRSDISLPDWLAREKVVSISGIDTRQLVRMVRQGGTVRCVISTTDSDPASLVAKAKAQPSTDGCDLASKVTTDKIYQWTEGYPDSYPFLASANKQERFHCVAYDFGAKRNILRSLVHAGFDVTVVPAHTPASQVLALNPDGIFLSNGPGDPAAVTAAIEAIAALVGKKPIFGICLGHQILSIVLGAKTYKMPFGHHGANHPVRDITTGRVEITSQNHSFAVDKDSLPDNLELTHVNLNDGTVSGMRDVSRDVISVQYHPEAAPGPLDSNHLFARFRKLVEERITHRRVLR